MPVTRITIMSAAPRRRPQAGDRRTTKKHGLQIRVQAMATWGGLASGRLVQNGRPVFDWCKPEDLQTWDRYHLTHEERARMFPTERELGYMQGRGAA